MPYSEPQRTLMGYLGTGPVSRVTEARLLGGPYIRFANVWAVVSFLYEIGAILGRAKRDKLTILEKMIGKPEREGELIEFMQGLAKKRREEFGGEPHSFLEFIASTESAFRGLSHPGFPDIKTAKKTLGEKWPLKGIEPIIKAQGLEGIGFGSVFPDLTEKMCSNFYENVDMDKWSFWRAHGLNIPEKPTKISFEEREQEVLTEVATYTRQYFPELIEPMGFKIDC